MDRYNNEGYLDPTAFEALSIVEREEQAANAYRPLVYIASPYAGDTNYNISRACGYCRLAIRNGCIPFAPHLLYPQFMDDDDKQQRELGIRFALIWLGKCDELWVCGDTVSDGMSREIARAKRRSMPIRYFNSKCEEVQI